MDIMLTIPMEYYEDIDCWGTGFISVLKNDPIHKKWVNDFKTILDKLGIEYEITTHTKPIEKRYWHEILLKVNNNWSKNMLLLHHNYEFS